MERCIMKLLLPILVLTRERFDAIYSVYPSYSPDLLIVEEGSLGHPWQLAWV
jgi:hypothetical protein